MYKCIASITTFNVDDNIAQITSLARLAIHQSKLKKTIGCLLAWLLFLSLKK